MHGALRHLLVEAAQMPLAEVASGVSFFLQSLW